MGEATAITNSVTIAMLTPQWNQKKQPARSKRVLGFDFSRTTVAFELWA
jgi:hypothetical protein